MSKRVQPKSTTAAGRKDENDGHIEVWLPVGPGVQEELIEEAPLIYFRPPYVGPAGWIGDRAVKGR